jgi:hypothetical protein
MTVDDFKKEANDAADKMWSTHQGRGIYGSYGLEDALRTRYNAVVREFPAQKPDTEEERKAYYENYAKMVRQEAIRELSDHILNRHSANGVTSLDDEFQRIADRWIVGVRTHDELNPTHLFNDKLRGHGQEAGSTDGRLLRKLMMTSAQDAATSDPSFDSYRNDIEAARTRLNTAETNLQSNLDDVGFQQEHEDAKQNLFNQNKALNEEVAHKLGNLLSLPGGSLALKKAIFLTQEKLRNPLGYKQKYARVVPFNDPNDPATPDKWVKASRRFYTPADIELPLPARPGGTVRPTSVVKMKKPSKNLLKFGPDNTELIDDVGQKSLGECWLQASAASLPRQTLGNMFSWKPSYGNVGVTTRLHDENGNPIYIRTQKKQLGHKYADHKALWPYALESAVAKVGRKEYRDFRKRLGFISRDENGMPVYSIRDVSSGPIAEAAKLLTGQAPLININEHNSSENMKHLSFSKAWEEAERRGASRGVATFANFGNPEGNDNGPEHAVTWLSNQPIANEQKSFLGIKWDSKIKKLIGNFGNPWAADPNEKDDGTLSHGRKRFSAPLSRAKEVSFLSPAFAARDMFVSAPSTHNLTPEEYGEQQRRRIGNFFTHPR